MKYKSNNARSLSRRRFVRGAAGAVLLGATGLGGGVLEADNLEVTHVDVVLPRFPNEANGLRIGLISDFHADYQHAVDRTARAVEMLVAENPDIVLIAGDYVSGYRNSQYFQPTVDALRPLNKTRGGTYAIMGNHDYWAHTSGLATSVLEQAGFVVLNNQSVPLPGVPGAYIVGLDDAWNGFMDVEKALQGVPKDAPKIVALHEPDFGDWIGPGFDLQLSGHSHGGQIRVPGLPVLHAPPYGVKYPEGLQRCATHLIYTTRGVGMINPQIRTFCPPEVTVLTLRNR